MRIGHSARAVRALVSATSGAEPPARPSPPGCHNRDRRIASNQRLASKHESRRRRLSRPSWKFEWRRFPGVMVTQ